MSRARAGIYAARLIYCDIGRVIRERQYNALAGRAVVGTWRKLRLAVRALIWAQTRKGGRASIGQAQSAATLQLQAAPLDEMRFLLPAIEGQ